jgi:hypothetical protein
MKIRFIIIIICLFIFGCKKHPFDYRNKFIGNYNFSVNEYTWIMGGPNWDTTYTFHGKITYGSSDNTVLISYCKDCSCEFTIYEDGTLGNSGKFDSPKQVSFSLHSGGLGGGWGNNVTGNKTK